jgi:hypothetical protein
MLRMHLRVLIPLISNGHRLRAETLSQVTAAARFRHGDHRRKTAQRKERCVLAPRRVCTCTAGATAEQPRTRGRSRRRGERRRRPCATTMKRTAPVATHGDDEADGSDGHAWRR